MKHVINAMQKSADHFCGSTIRSGIAAQIAMILTAPTNRRFWYKELLSCARVAIQLFLLATLGVFMKVAI